ncbi:MAG TPA: type IIL restriction-modification enzyme MmeI, partial [Rubricoccaceae bacterium]
MTVNTFIEKWRASGASERSNYALFFADLTAVLGVPPPDPATGSLERDGYTIDRTVTLESGATNYVDLYKRGCFVLEAKQGSDAPAPDERAALGLTAEKQRRGTARRGTRSWETAMQKAKGQARRYAGALPEADGWPPFLVVCDVGYCFDLYADFARQGKTYVAFPDQQSYRILIEDLEDEAVRETLRLVWADPMALDPQRRAVAATRELAGKLARLARSLEADGHAPGDVADFLMRALFTMFAEDVKLLPERSFTGLLDRYRENVANAPKALASLWATMKTGGFAGVLGEDVRHFNGYLFADATAPNLSAAQIELLIEAARADWTDVEPAIFGTLIEQALDPVERHKLGAHYTPRAYVERLVLPTVVEPLRDEWEAAQAAAALKEGAGDEAGARAEVERFHRRLCSVRVLDPACGTGNFLYVTLEHLKRLEGEVVDALAQFPGQQTLDMTGGLTVSPSQLLGVEFNPRAAAIARVVLWIGYLQWHFR